LSGKRDGTSEFRSRADAGWRCGLGTPFAGELRSGGHGFCRVNPLLRRGWDLDRIASGDTITCIGNLFVANCPPGSCCYRAEARHDHEFSSGFGEAEVRWLLTPKRRGEPGPEGPSEEIIAAIVQMKRRNPGFGCRRIAQQLSFAFGPEINKKEA
jgi:hypothetical protein